MNEFMFTKTGVAQYLYWQKQDKKTLKRINDLLEDIRRNGAMQGLGKPEVLKNRPAYSRRIDEKNRLVYTIDELQNIKFFLVRVIMKNKELFSEYKEIFKSMMLSRYFKNIVHKSTGDFCVGYWS